MAEPFRRSGLTLVKEFPEGVKVVSMIAHNGRVYIATEHQIWTENSPGDFGPVEFQVVKKEG